MKFKVGDYCYRPSWRYYRVCYVEEVDENGQVKTDHAIGNLPYMSKEEARKIVYEHNGWKTKG